VWQRNSRFIEADITILLTRLAHGAIVTHESERQTLSASHTHLRLVVPPYPLAADFSSVVTQTFGLR
jgi:hypothetical protein